MKLKVGSDCSGVGAFNQALKRIGINYEEAFACDFDYYARVTFIANYGTKEDLELALSKEHKKHSDNVKRIVYENKLEKSENDIKELNEANEFGKKFSFYYPFNMYEREIPKEPIDIYMSSISCQAFSLAGKRLGKNDPKGRGILFFNSLEFIEKNKPRFFIFENVKGLLSDDKTNKDSQYGNTFSEWINYLGGKSVNGSQILFPIDGSVPYHIYWKVLNAKDFGVPQNRERVFIIGIRDDQDNNFTFPKEEFLEKRLKDVLESEVDEKYYLSEKMVSGLKVNGEKKYINQDTQASQVIDVNGINPNLCAGTHGYANGYIEEPKIIQLNDPIHSNDRIYSSEGLSPTLNTMQGGNRQPFIEEPKICAMRELTTVQKDNLVIERSIIDDTYGFNEEPIEYTEYSPCLRSGRFVLKTEYKNRIRKLTPIECFRLMDFPDSLVHNARQAGVSDSQLYKEAGNSIVVSVLAKLIQRLPNLIPSKD